MESRTQKRGEKERLERERREFEELKLLVKERQNLEAERMKLASQKYNLESKSSPEIANKHFENDQPKGVPEENIKVEQNLDEVERLKAQLASLGISPISELNEIGKDGSFIAYDDGTVLDTKTNLMWWSETIEKGNGRSGAQFVTKAFRGGDIQTGVYLQ